MSDSPAPVLERSLYYGLLFMFLLYGFELYMYSHSLLIWLGTKGEARNQRRVYIIIGAISALLTAICAINNAVFMQHMWIEGRNTPEGGPLAYLGANSSVWYQTLGTGANMLTNFMGDGLLIYRCYLIWQANIFVVAFPILIYLGSMSMAIVCLYQSARPSATFFGGGTVDFGVPWAALSVSVNVVVTSLIVYQLMRVRKQLAGILPNDALRTYTGLSAILVESALPFSILGIIFAVTYGKHMEIGPAFLFVWAVFSALAPQFIIFRVAVGKSWTSDLIGQTKKEGIQMTSVTFHRQDNGSKTYALSAGSRIETKGDFDAV